MKPNSNLNRFLLGFFLVALLPFSTGCSLLLGNVKPSDEKADPYGILDLAKVQPDEWKRIEDHGRDNVPTEIPDSAYQSKTTSGTISINSACKTISTKGEASNSRAAADQLRPVTQLLLLGVSPIDYRNEREFYHQNLPALETTVRGRLSNEAVMIRTVVIQKANCMYDLLYLSAPEDFAKHEQAFSQFVASLHLRE